MLVIGLTGGIGSGKTTAAKLFAEHHVPIVDADLIARELVEPGQPALEELIDTFGPDIIKSDLSLDRQKLGKLIFNDDEQRRTLENIMHPLIRHEMMEHLDKVEGDYVVLVIPLLVDTGNWDMIDRILVVDVDEATQVERIMQRDETSRRHAKKIIDTQITRDDRLAAADDVIDNSGDISELRDQIDEIHQLYLAEANSHELQNTDTRPKQNNGSVCYEHPLNERVRTFLRLEHLFGRAQYHSQQNSRDDALSFISLLVEISNLVSRGDIKSEVIKELERQQSALKQHSELPNINQQVLNELLKQQNICIKTVHAMQGKLDQHLQNDLLFNSVRQRLTIPGGSSEFDLPIFNYWLCLSDSERLVTLNNWLKPFQPLKDAIDVCLSCIRQSTDPVTVTAEGGYFEDNLDQRTEPQLLRVLVERKQTAYPTISANKHRLNVRFLQWLPGEARAPQAEKDILFSLMICGI